MSLRGEILVAGDTRVNARGACGGPADAGLLVGGFFAGVDQVRTVPDLLNAGGNDGSGILRMVKLKMHAATHKAHLQHGTTPRRTCNGDRNGTRTELRVS